MFMESKIHTAYYKIGSFFFDIFLIYKLFGIIPAISLLLLLFCNSDHNRL